MTYGLPLSSDSSWASSLVCSRIRSPMRQMIRPRSDGLILLHGPSSNAFLAAVTARLMSSASPSAIRASVSPVAGLGVSKVLPDAAFTNCPLMNIWRGAPMNSSTLRSSVTVMGASSLLAPRLAEGTPSRLDSPHNGPARGPQGAAQLGSLNETYALQARRKGRPGGARDHRTAH